MNSQQFGSSTDKAIGFVAHKFKAGKKEREVNVPVFGFIHRDRSTYTAGKMKPWALATSKDMSDSDIRSIAAAIDKRARKSAQKRAIGI